MRDLIIETSDLRRSFDGQTALAGLDLQVPRGSIFGFLGRNGAGKTTTIRILTGLLKKLGGSAAMFGEPLGPLGPPAEIRRRIGVVTEDKELLPYMTFEQMIRFTRPFFPRWRPDLERRYLRMFDLPEDKNITDLSKGMRAKLMLLLAMSRGAELLVLDEPMDGLDPVGVQEVLREVVSMSASEETTVFFSSHQLEEVEQIAEHVAIIDGGRSILNGALDDLKARFRRLQIVLPELIPIPSEWARDVEHVRQKGRTVSILASRNVDDLMVKAHSLPGASVEVFPVGLKENFLDRVGSN